MGPYWIDDTGTFCPRVYSDTGPMGRTLREFNFDPERAFPMIDNIQGLGHSSERCFGQIGAGRDILASLINWEEV